MKERASYLLTLMGTALIIVIVGDRAVLLREGFKSFEKQHKEHKYANVYPENYDEDSR